MEISWESAVNQDKLVQDYFACAKNNDYNGMMKILGSMNPMQIQSVMQSAMGSFSNPQAAFAQALQMGTQFYNGFLQNQGAKSQPVSTNDAAGAVGNMINVTPSDGGQNSQ